MLLTAWYQLITPQRGDNLVPCCQQYGYRLPVGLCAAACDSLAHDVMVSFFWYAIIFGMRQRAASLGAPYAPHVAQAGHWGLLSSLTPCHGCNLPLQCIVTQLRHTI